MKPVTQKVLDVMKRDGHITRLVAMHMNIGCVRKAVSELRELGYSIRTDKRKDSEGNKYTRWVLESEPEQPIPFIVGNKYKVVDTKGHYFLLNQVVTYVGKSEYEDCYKFRGKYPQHLNAHQVVPV